VLEFFVRAPIPTFTIIEEISAKRQRTATPERSEIPDHIWHSALADVVSLYNEAASTNSANNSVQPNTSYEYSELDISNKCNSNSTAATGYTTSTCAAATVVTTITGSKTWNW